MLPIYPLKTGHLVHEEGCMYTVEYRGKDTKKQEAAFGVKLYGNVLKRTCLWKYMEKRTKYNILWEIACR